MSHSGLTYRIDPAQPVAGEVRRITAGLLDVASRALGRDPAPSVLEVAAAGRAVSEAGAVARLARGGLDRSARRAVTRRLAGVEAVLGSASVPPVTDTFEAVATAAAGSITTVALHRLRLSLAEQAAQEASARVRGDAPGALVGHPSRPLADWRTVAEDLDAAVLAASLWSVAPEGFAALAPGFERTYRRGQEALAAVDADGDLSAGTIAALADRARDHHHHLCLLRPVWPRVMKPLARESRTLADLADHQLALGAVRAGLLTLDEGQTRRDARAVVGVLDVDRAELAERTIALGTRLFADEPAALVARVALWWSVAAGASA